MTFSLFTPQKYARPSRPPSLHQQHQDDQRRREDGHSQKTSKKANDAACCWRRLSNDCKAICCERAGSPVHCMKPLWAWSMNDWKCVFSGPRFSFRRERWNCCRGSSMVWQIEVPTLPPRCEAGQQSDRCPAEMHRYVLVRRHAGRGEHQPYAQGQQHPRPNHLPGADLEIHPRIQ